MRASGHLQPGNVRRMRERQAPAAMGFGDRRHRNSSRHRSHFLTGDPGAREELDDISTGRELAPHDLHGCA